HPYHAESKHSLQETATPSSRPCTTRTADDHRATRDQPLALSAAKMLSHCSGSTNATTRSRSTPAPARALDTRADGKRVAREACRLPPTPVKPSSTMRS